MGGHCGAMIEKSGNTPKACFKGVFLLFYYTPDKGGTQLKTLTEKSPELTSFKRSMHNKRKAA